MEYITSLKKKVTLMNHNHQSAVFIHTKVDEKMILRKENKCLIPEKAESIVNRIMFFKRQK